MFVLNFYTNFFSAIFVILSKIRRDVTINVSGSARTVSVIRGRFERNLNFLQIFKILRYQI